MVFVTVSSKHKDSNTRTASCPPTQFVGPDCEGLKFLARMANNFWPEWFKMREMVKKICMGQKLVGSNSVESEGLSQNAWVENA